MPTIVRDAPKRERKRGRPKAEPSAVKNAAPAVHEDATEQTIWKLRQQISACAQRIDELETMVYKLAYGGKEKEFYTVEETAEIWGMAKSSLYVMIRDGRLPAVRIGEVLRISKKTLLQGTR